MDDKILLTGKGLKDLQAELEERKTVVRKQIADEIEVARQQGDLSENSAYKQAMENKEFNENRITILEGMINNSEIVKANKTNKVGIGSRVKVVSTSNRNESEYTVVGQSESDPAKGKISIISPIGAALNGKKVGDKVSVDLPAGKIIFEIKKIS